MYVQVQGEADMSRRLKDWLTSYKEFTAHTEAPQIMHFFSGVAAIAGALRRKVWIDHGTFRWYPSFYIILVAPPGIVAKSTTSGIAMDLLRAVPGIKFGPDIITWPALVTAYAGASEAFQIEDEWHPMSPLVFHASEFGNLVNPQDREMINLLIELWDGRNKLEKVTKLNGNDTIEAPWISLIAGTTPHWIADNMPQSTIGGGFTSRCIFVYAEEKSKYCAFPRMALPKDFARRKADLIHDLEHISVNLAGEYSFTKEAVEWQQIWYEHLWKVQAPDASSSSVEGYLARKQTHLNKLAMIFAASRRDELVLIEEDFVLADLMLKSIEVDLEKVFSRIGKTKEAAEVDKLLAFIRKKGKVEYYEAYRVVHSYFQNARAFEGIISGAIRAGYVNLEQNGVKLFVSWAGD